MKEVKELGIGRGHTDSRERRAAHGWKERRKEKEKEEAKKGEDVLCV